VARSVSAPFLFFSPLSPPFSFPFLLPLPFFSSGATAHQSELCQTRLKISPSRPSGGSLTEPLHPPFLSPPLLSSFSSFFFFFSFFPFFLLDHESKKTDRLRYDSSMCELKERTVSIPSPFRPSFPFFSPSPFSSPPLFSSCRE